jgi:hypothetical protein
MSKIVECDTVYLIEKSHIPFQNGADVMWMEGGRGNRDACNTAGHVRDACNIGSQKPKNRRTCTAAACADNRNTMAKVHASAATDVMNVMTCIVLK